MKYKMTLLAAVMMSASLYAQTAPTLAREDILAVFRQFNPSVLAVAEKDASYQAVLEQFLTSTQWTDTSESRMELIAAVRNFDRSIHLAALTEVYGNMFLAAKASGQDIAPSHNLFRQDVADIMARVWAVTVCVREYQLDQAQAALNGLSKTDLTDEERATRRAQLLQDMALLKADIRAYKKNPGEQILSSTDNYVAQVEKAVEQNNFSVQNKAALQSAQQAAQATNLQVKSKNKKPVAK